MIFCPFCLCYPLWIMLWFPLKSYTFLSNVFTKLWLFRSAKTILKVRVSSGKTSGKQVRNSKPLFLRFLS